MGLRFAVIKQAAAARAAVRALVTGTYPQIDAPAQAEGSA
jgi:hypothetical protein